MIYTCASAYTCMHAVRAAEASCSRAHSMITSAWALVVITVVGALIFFALERKTARNTQMYPRPRKSAHRF